TVTTSGATGGGVMFGQPTTYSASAATPLTSYQLSSDGALTRSTGDGAAVIDTGVASAFRLPVGSGVYDLEDNGQLWFYSGSGWTLVDVGVATLGADANGTSVFILEANGNARLYQAATATLSTAPLATSVTALGVAPDGT